MKKYKSDKEKLKSFISEVEAVENTGENEPNLTVASSSAIEAKDFIKSFFERGRKGGKAARGKSGRPVEYDDEAHIRQREYNKRHLAKKKAD